MRKSLIPIYLLYNLSENHDRKGPSKLMHVFDDFPNPWVWVMALPSADEPILLFPGNPFLHLKCQVPCFPWAHELVKWSLLLGDFRQKAKQHNLPASKNTMPPIYFQIMYGHFQ